MTISIITVTYNARLTIEDTIKSVISQTVFDKVNYILIDGGSTDGTLEIVNRYAQHFAVIVSEKDNGIYDAMNKGVALATGDVVGILNADDIYAGNTVLELVLNMFVEEPSLDIIYGDLVYVKKEDITSIRRNWLSGAYYPLFFERGNVPAHPTLFLKKKVYDEAGIFDTEYKLAADYEFMLRVFKKHSFTIAYLNRCMIKMRLGGATNKSFLNIYKGNLEIFKAWKKNDLKVPITLFPLRIIKRLSQFFKT